MTGIKKISIVLMIVVLLVLSGCAKEDDLKNVLTNNLSKYAIDYASHGEDYGSHFFDYSPVSTEQINYPAKYDLRDKGIITSVKDQGNYGTCWALLLWQQVRQVS